MKKFHLLILLLGSLICFQNAYSDQSFLVDSDWLGEHIDDKNLVILEVRYHPHRYYTIGHVQGAVQVQRFKDLGDNMASPLMRFPSRETFQATLRNWGVNNDSTIVIYDDSRTALASRAYFLLELYGYDMSKVKLMQGGTIEWSAFNDLSKEAARPKQGNVELKEANPKMFAEWASVYDNVVSRQDPDFILLDARPVDHYTGKVIKHAIRGGHIPGAVNIVSLDGTDGQSQNWLSEEELAAMYKPLAKDKTIYVYCHDGFRMSLAYTQLKSLGYKDVRLYNGGWSHWGNALTLPVIEGDQPLDDEFAL